MIHCRCWHLREKAVVTMIQVTAFCMAVFCMPGQAQQPDQQLEHLPFFSDYGIKIMTAALFLPKNFLN